jgi:putative hydrolase of the HAD superfamily
VASVETAALRHQQQIEPTGSALAGTSISPKFVIFDLDGVLRFWPKSDAELEAKFDLSVGAISGVAFEPELLSLALSGAITDAEWRLRIAKGLVSHYSFQISRAKQAVFEWSAATGAINLPVLELVRRVRKCSKVALFTNATAKVLIDLEKLSLLPELDVVVHSSSLGFAKPSPEAFVAALHHLGVEAAEVLFIDDTPANVAGAMGCGILAHQYTSLESLSSFLKECNVL